MVTGTNRYVSVTGRDTAGKAAAPFAILKKAVETARTGNPEDTAVWVAEGRYFPKEALSLAADFVHR